MPEYNMRLASIPIFNLRTVNQCCRHIIEMIEAGTYAKADIIVFPESATNSYNNKTTADDRRDIEKWMPEILNAVKKAARPWVILGTYTFEPDKIWNSAQVIDPSGNIRATYHKIQEGGRKWLMLEISGVIFTIAICADFWIPCILHIPKMLGSQVCLYPHASGPVLGHRRDYSPVYFTRAWESKMSLVMADCSWIKGKKFRRPAKVPYPYDFSLHLENQSCIIQYDEPVARYKARFPKDLKNGMLVADIDTAISKKPLMQHPLEKGLEKLLEYHQATGAIAWMK